MVKIYTSPSLEWISLVKHALENEDIESVVLGQHRAAAAGGIAPTDAWLELWVLNPYESERARDLVQQVLDQTEDDEEQEQWLCPDCIEWREGQFTNCWKCGAERLS